MKTEPASNETLAGTIEEIASCLFVGGPLDGQRMALPGETSTVRVPRPPLEPDKRLRFPQPRHPPDIYYRKVSIHGRDGDGAIVRFTVYALEGDSDVDVLANLIAGYRPS
jgi:hypothetical protein